MKTNIHFTISRSRLHRIRNVSDKSCRENQNIHFTSNYFFFLQSCGLRDEVGKCVEPDRQQMTNGACAFHAGYLSLQIRTQNM
jgi:hypothetical protein